MASLNDDAGTSPRPAVLVVDAMPGSAVVTIGLHPADSVGVPNGDVVGSDAGEDGTGGITDSPAPLFEPPVVLDSEEAEVALPVTGDTVALPIGGGVKVVLPTIGTVAAAAVALPVVGHVMIVPSAVPASGPRFPNGNGPRLPRRRELVLNGVVLVAVVGVVELRPDRGPTWAAAVPQPTEIAAIIARRKSLLR